MPNGRVGIEREYFCLILIGPHLWSSSRTVTGAEMPLGIALGVSSKQTGKARQAFMRSARQAGFFVHGEDRLVKPTFNQVPTTRPIETPTPSREIPEAKKGGGEPPSGDWHPFIQGLLKSLPTPETDWPAAARIKWLQTAANIFDLMYKGDGGIEVRLAAIHSVGG